MQELRSLELSRCGSVEFARAYALQSLPANDVAAAEAHIASCPDCREELESLRPVIDRFVCWPIDVLRPTTALQARLALRIAEETGKQPVPPPSRQWSEPEWEQIAPGIECKLLATDTERDRVSMLVRLAPGASYPAHTHADIEELHLLDGELWIDGRKLVPGDYSRGAPGAAEDRVWSETGCTCVLVTSAADVLRADSDHIAAVEQPASLHSLQAVLQFPPDFVDLLPVAAYACDASGRILWFNKRAAGLWGRAPRIGDDTELFCGSYRLYFDGRQIARAETPMAVALRSGEAIHGVEGLMERPDGSRIWATVHIDPVKAANGEILGAINCFSDTTELHQARAALAEREAHTRRLLDALPAAVYTTDAAGRITYYNKAAAELAGREPIVGSDEWCVTWKRYRTDGTPLPHDQCPTAVALKEQQPSFGIEAIAERPDGTRIPFASYPTPLFDASGTLIGAVNMLVDMTERKNAEQRQQLLVNEMVHRSKNLLAVIDAIASHSLSGTRSLEEAREALTQRIQAFARSQNLLVNGASAGASMADVCRLEFDGLSGRAKFAGPDVILNSKATQTFALVVHELATNATKYGALSDAGGRIAIEWSIDNEPAEPIFRLRWLERDGPTITTPTRRGFGRILLERMAAHEFGTQPVIRFEPEGLTYEITAPLSAVIG